MVTPFRISLKIYSTSLLSSNSHCTQISVDVGLQKWPKSRYCIHVYRYQMVTATSCLQL